MSELPQKSYTVTTYDSNFPEPDDGLVLWRYLDFPKLLDLISSSSLKMPRASSLDDGYEGVLGNAATQATLEAWKQRGEPGYLRNAAWNQELDATFFWRERTYVSCWNAFTTENAGLWRIYGDDKGIVVKTTWGRLKSSLNGTSDCVEQVFAGMVQYRDFACDKNFTDSYTDQYFVKRIEFEHEREFRLVAHDASREHEYTAPEASDLPKFATLECDLNVLIEELIVSPRLGSWVEEAVTVTCKRLGGTWPVRRSNLYDLPERRSNRF